MNRSRKLTKWIGCFLIASLLTGMTTPALASQTAANMLRLVAVEGEVGLSTQNGKDVPVFADMKLHNGYRLTTALASYAYISLDDTKVIKLDSLSEAEIRKQGNDLEILLISGSLFFNVTAPLRADENLNIRTSTTVTGIRGTSGVVRVVSSTDQIYIDEIQIWEGSSAVKNENPVNGRVENTRVTTGESVISSISRELMATQPASITKTMFDRTRMAGYAAVEIGRDPEFKDKLRTYGYDVELIEARAAKWLEEDEEEKRIATEELGNINSGGQQLFKPMFDDSDSSGGERTVTYEPSVKLTMRVDVATINRYLGRSYVKDITIMAGGFSDHLELDQDVTIPGGKSLTLESGVVMSVAAGKTLTIDGTLTSAEPIDNYGTINNNSMNTLDAKGGITNQSGAELMNSGRILAGASLVNLGSATLGGILDGSLDNQADLTLDGVITGSVVNSGTVLMNGGEVRDTLTLNDGSFTFDGGNVGKNVTVSGTAVYEQNGGTVNGEGPSALTCHGGDVTLNAGVIDGGNGHAISASGGTIRWNPNATIKTNRSAQLLDLSGTTVLIADGVVVVLDDMCVSGYENGGKYQLAGIIETSPNAIGNAKAGTVIKLANGSIVIDEAVTLGGDLSIGPIIIDLNGGTMSIMEVLSVEPDYGLTIRNGIIEMEDGQPGFLNDGEIRFEKVKIRHNSGTIENRGSLLLKECQVFSDNLDDVFIDSFDGRTEIIDTSIKIELDDDLNQALITAGAEGAASSVSMVRTQISADKAVAIRAVDGAELTIGRDTIISGRGYSTLELNGQVAVSYLGGTIVNDGGFCAVEWNLISPDEAQDLFPEPDEFFSTIKSNGELVIACGGEELSPPSYTIVTQNGYWLLTKVNMNRMATPSGAAVLSANHETATDSNAPARLSLREAEPAQEVLDIKPEQIVFVKKEEGEDE